MNVTGQHAAYEVLYSDAMLMETALIAEQFYSNEPYHNFGHILNAVQYARAEIDTYHANEPATLPMRSIYKALLLHDTQVHLPLTDRFPTYEHRSAFLAGYLLRELGDDEEEISHIQRWIINTNPKFPCQDDAARIVCRGDLGNTADDLPVFVREFVNVYRENQIHKLRNGRPQDIVNPLIAARESMDYIKMYFRQDLTLGEGDWDKTGGGVCSFVARALANFSHLPTAVEKLPSEVFEFPDDSLDA